MNITRTSLLTKVTRTRDINVTPEQMARYEAGMKIQDAFPHLNADDREFILSGITPEEWDEHMGEDDENFHEGDEGAF
jgi:hypothetical protein